MHTITFKLWNPDSRTNKELFVQETRSDGNTHSYDPEHFFYKLVGDQRQASRLSDYWRCHYGAPLRNTPSDAVHTLYATSTAQPPTPDFASCSTSDLAITLYEKLFGTGGHFDPRAPTDETTWPATELTEPE